MKQNGYRGIIHHPISILHGKKVVIDVSIYLYRFKSMNELIRDMTKFIIMFQTHQIIPIFVFDGPPRSNKKELLKERRKLKDEAWKEYHESESLTEAHMIKLKKTFTRISKQDVDSVKDIMKNYGVRFIDAPHESDEVCAKLMLDGHVDACMSDDMDMFMYGCSWVIRDVNLEDQTAVCYYTQDILSQLKLSHHEFKQICVLSGSDYYKSSYTLYNVMSMFNAFKRTKHTDFYEWMKIYHAVDIDSLWEAYREYDVSKMILYTAGAGVAF